MIYIILRCQMITYELVYNLMVSAHSITDYGLNQRPENLATALILRVMDMNA